MCVAYTWVCVRDICVCEREREKFITGIFVSGVGFLIGILWPWFAARTEAWFAAQTWAWFAAARNKPYAWFAARLLS